MVLVVLVVLVLSGWLGWPVCGIICQSQPASSPEQTCHVKTVSQERKHHNITMGCVHATKILTDQDIDFIAKNTAMTKAQVEVVVQKYILGSGFEFELF